MFVSARALTQHNHAIHATCNECGASFGTQAACNQHYAAKHGSSSAGHSCTMCTKSFGTAESLEQHCSDAHAVCEECDAVFESTTSRDQHYAAKHGSSSAGRGTGGPVPHAPRAPMPELEGTGEWVEPGDFNGRKSFGYFRCTSCGHRWISAHTSAREGGHRRCPEFYRQECASCSNNGVQREMSPEWMWQNYERDGRRGAARDNEGAES